MHTQAFLVAIATSAVAAIPAFAGIAASTGVEVLTPAPTDSTSQSTLRSDDNVLLFEESVGVIIPEAYFADFTGTGTLDSGNLPAAGLLQAGTVVNSYLAHAEPLPGNALTFSGSVTFGPNEFIIGVYYTVDGLEGSDELFGNPDTTYDAGFAGRGTMEGIRDLLVISEDRHMISFAMRSRNGDELRIITASVVPAPASAVSLLGLGLVASRRRRA